jgi:hypothetical protein
MKKQYSKAHIKESWCKLKELDYNVLRVEQLLALEINLHTEDHQIRAQLFAIVPQRRFKVWF